MSIAASITVVDLSKVQAAALAQKAAKLGLSPERYVKQLISADLELDRIAASRSFDELAEPFRAALSSLSESELDTQSRERRRTPRQKARR